MFQMAPLKSGAISYDGLVGRAPNVRQVGAQAQTATQLATATSFIQTQGSSAAINGMNAHGVVKAGSRYWAVFTGRDSSTHPGVVLWYTDDNGATWTKHSQLDSSSGDQRPCIAVDDEVSPTHLYVCWAAGNAVDLPLKFAHITTNIASGSPGAATATTIDAGGAGVGVYQPCLFVTNTGTNPRVWIIATKQTASTPTYEYRLWYVGLASTDTAGNWTTINNVGSFSSGTLTNKAQTGTAWIQGGVDKAVLVLLSSPSPDKFNVYSFDPTAGTPAVGAAVASNTMAISSGTYDWISNACPIIVNGTIPDYLLCARFDGTAGTLTAYKSTDAATWTALSGFTSIPGNRCSVSSDNVDYYLLYPNNINTPTTMQQAYVNTSNDAVTIGDYPDIAAVAWWSAPKEFAGTMPFTMRAPAQGTITPIRSGAIFSAGRVVNTPISATDSSGTGTDTATEAAAYTVTDSGTSTFEGATVVISVAGTDQDGTPAEATALTVAETATDSDGTPVEQAQLALSGSDVNGTTTEATVLAAKPTGTDAGTDSETAAPAVTYTVSDASGSITEASVLKAAESGADLGQSSAELAALLAAASSLDTGGATGETGTLVYLIVAPDAGSSTQIGALAAVASVSDSGSDVEAIVLVAVASTPDSGSGSDVGGVGNVTFVTGTDANGSTTELASFFAALTGTQVGSDLESAIQVVQVLVTDANLNVVEAAVLVASALLSDTATASEVATLLAKPTGSDVGGSVESSRVGVTGSDSGSSGESAAPSQIITAAEQAVATELADLAGSLLSGDSGTAAESATAVLLSLLAAIKTGTIQSSGADGRLNQGREGSIEQPKPGRIL